MQSAVRGYLDAGAAAGVREVTLWALPVLFAIPLHEAAHGLAAWRLGDDTAYRLGRVTLNPLRHLDPFGTVMLVLVGFGWGKPVPISPPNLRSRRFGSAAVASRLS